MDSFSNPIWNYSNGTGIYCHHEIGIPNRDKEMLKGCRSNPKTLNWQTNMFRTESRGSKLFLWYATTWWPRWGDQSAKIWKIKETTANKKLRSKLGTLWSETLYQWVYSIQYIKYFLDIAEYFSFPRFLTDGVLFR